MRNLPLRRPLGGRRAALAGAVTALALIAAPLATAADGSAAGGATAPTGANVNTIKMPTIATDGTPANTTNTASPSPTTATKPTGGAFGLTKTPGSKSSVQRRTSAGKLSTGAILAAVIGGLLALACLAWAALRWSAVEPRWTLPLRHSMAEAGFRASSVWAEFTDWIRLGH